MLRRFRLEEPETIPEASELLSRHGESARIYAGGTELLLVMKEGLAHYERLVNIKTIPDLDRVERQDGVISIGALATHRRLATDEILNQQLPALVAMEKKVAKLDMLDEVTADMQLDYPGKEPFRADPSYPEQVLRRPEINFRPD